MENLFKRKKQYMSINLIETLRKSIGGDLSNYSAEFFDEDESKTSAAVSGSTSTIMAALIQKCSTDKGTKQVMSMLEKEDPNLIDVEDIFKRSPQTVNGLWNSGSRVITPLMGSGHREASNAVAETSGIKKQTASKLLRMSTPFVMSSIAKQVQDNNLDAGGLKSLIMGQKAHVEATLPEGAKDALELSSFGWTKKAPVVVKEVKKTPKPKKVKVAKEKVIPVKKEVVAPVAANTSGRGMGFLKWLLPLLVFLGILWFMLTKVLGCGGVDTVAKTVTAPVAAVKEVVKAPVKAVTNVFGNINNAALGLLNNIKFAAGSAGEQMLAYIKGGVVGDGRFRFKNLNFASGSANIAGESGLEVDNLAAILNAYPDIKVNIEGYTDSQGKAESNQVLSQNRADAVRARLLAANIGDARITTKGFGAANPVADNATSEGRAQNRRIEVVIVK